MQSDPRQFSELHPPPLLITDEVQYAPVLFPYIKMAVDSNQTPGQYWMTGSQMFRMMQGVSESLGRQGRAAQSLFLQSAGDESALAPRSCQATE